ncbi:MAG: hypothetical protein SGI88_18340 [Candidatus Hydrogenedentes bacterium]|nr:hypothetical protein [Candidatus Hydrogenedentota bacterium]
MRGNYGQRGIVCAAAAILTMGFAACSGADKRGAPPRKPGIDQRETLETLLAWRPDGAPDSDGSGAASRNLIENFSFEHRDDTGRPRGWAVSPAESIVPDAEAGAGAKEGAQSLTLRGNADVWTVVAYAVPLIAGDAGKRVTASVWGKASLANAMFLTICVKDGSNVQGLVSQAFPESKGEWVEVRAETLLPEDVDTSNVQLRIIIRNDPKGLYRLDAAWFEVGD